MRVTTGTSTTSARKCAAGLKRLQDLLHERDLRPFRCTSGVESGNLQKECWNVDLLLRSSAWRGTMISHRLRHTACLTARVDDFCDHGHTLNHMIVVRISGRSWREPVLNLTSRKPNEQVRWLILGVATPLSHLPLGQEIGSEKTSNCCCELWMVGVRRAIQLSHLHSIKHADSEEPPPTSELPGWLVHGVATQLSHLPPDQDTESLEPPPSSYCLDGWCMASQHDCRTRHSIKTLSLWNLHRLLYCLDGWYLVLQHNCHIYHPIKTLSLWNLLRLLYCQGGWYLALQHDLGSNRCTGPADLRFSVLSLNHGHLSLQELVEDLLCRPRDTWKEVGLFLLLEVVKCVSLTPEECRGSTVCLLLIKATGLGNTTSTSLILSVKRTWWISTVLLDH